MAETELPSLDEPWQMCYKGQALSCTVYNTRLSLFRVSDFCLQRTENDNHKSHSRFEQQVQVKGTRTATGVVILTLQLHHKCAYNS